MAAKLCAVTTWLVALVSLLAATEGADPPVSDGRHPLTWPSSCYAFGPQAVIEALRQKVDDVNAGQMEKYLKILKYLTEVPRFLDNYGSRGDMAEEHGDKLTRMERTLQQRMQLVRLDVLLPWVKLLQLQQLADVRGPLQAATKRAFYTNLHLTLNSTEATKRKILDSISGLVDQFRTLFISYKKIMVSWVETAWVDDSEEQKHTTIHNILWHDFPPMLAKPLSYLLEDKDLEFYHPFPCGYEDVFDIFQKLRSTASQLESTSVDDARWKLLLEQIPKGGSSSEEPRPVTQAQIDMEEEVLSTHIVDMLTGYPKKKGKQS